MSDGTLQIVGVYLTFPLLLYSSRIALPSTTICLIETFVVPFRHNTTLIGLELTRQIPGSSSSSARDYRRHRPSSYTAGAADCELFLQRLPCPITPSQFIGSDGEPPSAVTSPATTDLTQLILHDDVHHYSCFTTPPACHNHASAHAGATRRSLSRLPPRDLPSPREPYQSTHYQRRQSWSTTLRSCRALAQAGATTRPNALQHCVHPLSPLQGQMREQWRGDDMSGVRELGPRVYISVAGDEWDTAA
jgi:hypothetical protein